VGMELLMDYTITVVVVGVVLKNKVEVKLTYHLQHIGVNSDMVVMRMIYTVMKMVVVVVVVVDGMAVVLATLVAQVAEVHTPIHIKSLTNNTNKAYTPATAE